MLFGLLLTWINYIWIQFQTWTNRRMYIFTHSPFRVILPPNSLQSISDAAFDGFVFESVSFFPYTNKLYVHDSFIEDISERNLIWYFGCDQTIKIPSSIEILCKSYFLDCQSIHCVEFEFDLRVQRIEEYAFQCSKLIKIIVFASVKVIYAIYFALCQSFTSVRIGRYSKLQWIETVAFRETDLKVFSIFTSIKYIGSSFFVFVHH